MKRIRIESRTPAESRNDDRYEVGYGRPPKDHQFKPGQSGNPRGKSRGSRNFGTDVKAVLKEPVAVSRDGKTKNVSTQQATLLRLREKALSGDARALDRLLSLAQSYNSEEIVQAAQTMAGEDAALFEVLAARVRNGAVSIGSEADVPVPDTGSYDLADGKLDEGDEK